MGRKPALGLVGACLASVALVGCDHQNLQPSGTKKDVTATGTSGNTGWKTLPANQSGASTAGTGTTGSPSWGNTASAGAGTGSFNVNPRGTVGEYPDGRTMTPQTGSTGGVERVGYGGPSNPDMKITSTTVQTPAAPAADPVVKPLATGAVPSGGQFNTPYPTTPPVPSTLPPLTPAGPAHPRVDDIPPPITSGRGPVVAPPPVTGPTSGAPVTTSAPPLPPPAPPPVSSGPDLGAPPASDLPAVPPLPPVSPGTQSLQKPPLRGTSVPTSPTGNPANFQ
ncbi:MAG TPA: hypothetical protein VFW33_19480 [Gemmataceae bacterium]|nr:hypothetical protein [Gemmataceae bacterium]